MRHAGGPLSERDAFRMIKVAKAQGSTESALRFFDLCCLAATFSRFWSERQRWLGMTAPGREQGAAPGRLGPSSALPLPEVQAHLLIGNQDNAGHAPHLPCLGGQDHFVLLDQLGGHTHRR